MHKDVKEYHTTLTQEEQLICEKLAQTISRNLPEAESKIWHRHPVWFIEGNPIVGYSKLKDSIRLLFWSGQSFHEESLTPEGSFKAAEKRYKSVNEVDVTALIIGSKNLLKYNGIIKT